MHIQLTKRLDTSDDRRNYEIHITRELSTALYGRESAPFFGTFLGRAIRHDGNKFTFACAEQEFYIGERHTMKGLLKELTTRLQVRFGTDVKTAWSILERLTGELSPENLTCDGELRGRGLQRKKARIDAEWRECEKVLGRKVTENEVWQRITSTA